MSDKILTEAYARLTAIEEADDDYVPMSREEREHEQAMRDARNRSGEEDSRAFDHVTGGDELEETEDPHVLHDAAIDMLDDMLASSEDQYGHQADILRYAIKRLQEVGLGR